MRPFGGRFALCLGFITTLLCCVTAGRINATIYDTDLGRVTYAPSDKICARWTNWIFWRTCHFWASPWQSEVYRSRGKLATVHRSLDHQHPFVTINFQGSAIWIYGPPRSQLAAIPGDYKICLYENHRLAYEPLCYRVNIAEAYSTAEDFESPVVIFSRGSLQYHEHRVVISVGDPAADGTYHYRGIQFSHAVYTIERPTPWPVEEDRWRFREVVMHDTHPLLSYSPREPISHCTWWWWCWDYPASGWAAKAYRAEDRSIVSWHELRSQGERSLNQWGVDAIITAGAVALYGIPKAHIANAKYLSHLCVHIDSGPCEIVDVQHAYLNQEHHHESVMLWRNNALDPSRKTRVSIRLMRTSSGSVSVFPFKALHYYEQKEYSSPNPVGRSENIGINHDDRAIVYHPGRRCVRHFAWWCTKWFDPWTWREEGPSGSVLTYRSTVAWYRTTEDPAITLNFRGSAVYVYGAPRSFIKAPHAPQHICINNVCQVVDIEQAYLNAPQGYFESAGAHGLLNYTDSGEDSDQEHVLAAHNTTILSPLHPELDPVLIWSMTGLDDKVEHTLRLALASLPSAGDAEMSIAKVVYTKVNYERGQTRPDTPVPQPDRSYEGPLYPPHATKWAPRPPSPPPSLPSPSSPSLPPSQSSPTPSPTAPPTRHSPGREPSKLILIIILCVLFVPLALFVLCIFLALCSEPHTPEAQPIFRSHTPPPRYEILRPSNLPVSSVQPPAQPRQSHTPNTRTYSAASNINGTTSSNPTHTYRNPSSKTVPEGPKIKPAAPQPPYNPVSSSHSASTSKLSKPDQQQQNNHGTCLGPNLAPPKPSYSEASSTWTRSRVAPDGPTSSNPFAAPTTPTHCPISASTSTAHTANGNHDALSVSQNIADAIPNYDSIASTPSPQAASRPSLPNTAPRSSSSAQPPPPPQSPPPPEYATLVTTLVAPPQPHVQIARSHRSSPQVIQPTQTPFRTTSNVNSAERQAPASSQRVVPPQMRQQNTLPELQADLRPPRPRGDVQVYTPALAEWAANQGYRIDGLMDAAALRGQAPLGPRNQGQAVQPQGASSSSESPQNAPPRGMPSWRTQAPGNGSRDNNGRGQGPREMNTGPSNGGAAPSGPGNSQRNRRGRAPRGSSANGAASTFDHNQNDRQSGGRAEANNGERGTAGERGGRGGRGGRGRGGRRRNGRGQGQQFGQNQ